MNQGLRRNKIAVFIPVCHTDRMTRGRPTIPDKEKRTERFVQMLTHEERALIDLAAELDGDLPTRWARKLLVEKARRVVRKHQPDV